jgi:hypothetical protein
MTDLHFTPVPDRDGHVPTVRDLLSRETRGRFDRLSSLIGQVGAVALDMLAEDIWEEARMYGYDDGYRDGAREPRR